MTEQEKQQLYLNVARTSAKAKKGWVRGKIGHSTSEEGYFDPLTLEVFNTTTGKESTLGQYLSDLGDLKEPLKLLEKEVK
jgi:hypothetical protein